MNGLEMIVLALAFIVVLTCTMRALSFSGLFGGFTRTVVSLCVSALGILGLISFKSNHGVADQAPVPHGSPLFIFILLPAGAMALAMVGTLLISVFLRLTRRHSGKSAKPELQQDPQESNGPNNVRLFGEEPDDRTTR
jgi:hypothetical protein